MSTPSFSTVTYTGDGATTTFTIPFPYIEQADIVVSVNDVVTNYTFLSSTQVVLATAPFGGSAVKIARQTDISEAAIVFEDGAPLTQDDLNTAEDQMLYSIQELTDTQNYWVQFIQAQAFTGGGGSGGAVLPPVSNVNNGSLLVAFDSSWNIYSLAQGRSLLGIPIEGCGNVAGLTVGTSAGQVPTFDLLGAAASHGVGTSGTELVPFSSFANGAFTTVGSGVGQIPTWIDLGGGTPGYPAFSGQAITNIIHALPYTRIEYQTAFNTAGGNYTSNPTFQPVALNTLIWDDTTAFAINNSTNVITIPPGTYTYKGRAWVQGIGKVQLKLVTTGGLAIYPNNNPGPTVDSTNGQYAEVEGKFGVATTTLAYLQIAGTSNNSSTNAFGVDHNQSAWGTNTYSTLEFWKVQ